MADTVNFSGTVRGLQPGDNIITFEAEDAAGKKVQVQRTVNYTGAATEPVADNGELYGYGEQAIDANAAYEKYTVTNLNDSGTGSLRDGLSALGAHSVRVDPALAGGHIHLASQIPIRGKKDCNFGNLVTVGGDRFSISGGSATHVVFRNVRLGTPTGRHFRDAVVVFQGANDLNIWFDKITSNGENDDGLIDIVGHYNSQGSTNYPAGWVFCSKSRMRLNGGYKEFLYGSNSSDYAAKNIYVTWYRCYVDGTTYRLPFVRYATVDLVNCWVDNWGLLLEPPVKMKLSMPIMNQGYLREIASIQQGHTHESSTIPTARPNLLAMYAARGSGSKTVLCSGRTHLRSYPPPAIASLSAPTWWPLTTT